MTVIDAGACVLRTWRESDAAQLVRIADDADVARYMADRFPHPYTAADAAEWLGGLHLDGVHFAVEAGGELAGGIGGVRLPQERERTMFFGYWFGRAFWGQGLATVAAGAFAKHVFDSTNVLRLETTVYAPNVASMRVLEKSGFQREGILRRAVVKHGDILDAVMFARLRA